MLGIQWEHLLGRLFHFFIYGFSAPWWTILGCSQTEAPRLLDWILPTAATLLHKGALNASLYQSSH